MAMSFFEMLQSKQISMVPAVDRTIVVVAQHAVGKKKKIVESILLGVDKKRSLSLVEQQSLLLTFDVAAYGQKRRNLRPTDAAGEFRTEYPGYTWYWLLPAAVLQNVGAADIAAAVKEALNDWRERLLPYVMDAALPCPWENAAEDGEDAEDEPAAPKVPTNEELMAMWMATQKQAAPVPVPATLQYNLPQAPQPKVVKIG